MASQALCDGQSLISALSGRMPWICRVLILGNALVSLVCLS